MIRRAWLYLTIRCLEATADGRAQVMGLVADKDVRGNMLLAQASLLLQITLLKAEYRRACRG